MANTKVTGSVIADGAITAAKIASGALDSIISGYLTTNTYATQSYVTTAVSNLIDAAPASLDTLNELAAALNDDANFATTVTNSLATKLNLSGGNITGSLGIGVASPSFKLDIVGSDNSQLRLDTSDAFDTTIIMDYNGGGATNRARIRNAAGALAFNTANSLERMRITSAGNVGIGTSSPDKNLEVLVGGINQSSTIRITGSDGAGAKHPLDLKMDGATDTFSILIGAGGGATPSTVLFAGNRNGNVGIGTSSPNQALTIQKSGYPIINFYDSTTARGDIGFNTGTTSFNISSYSTIPMAIYTNSAERMRIASNGYVGIKNSTTKNLLTINSENHVSPTNTDRILNWYDTGGTGFFELHNNKIDIAVGNNDASSALQPTSIGLALFNNNPTNDVYTPAITFGGLSSSSTYMNGTAAIAAQLKTHATDGNFRGGELVFFTSGTTDKGLKERARITSDSKMVFKPLDEALDTIKVYRGNTTAYMNNSAIIDASGGLTNIRNKSNDVVRAITFSFSTDSSTNYSERMRITSGGEVLIGTTSSPSIYGLVSIRGTNKGLTIQDAATNNYRALYSQSGNLYFYNGSNEGFLNSSGAWINASDTTIKKDVKDIQYGLDSVMQLKPKWYRMVDDDLEQIGFIAQDVEEVVPELVSTSKKGMKGLSYGQLTAVLVKAIQELKAEIETLKSQINA